MTFPTVTTILAGQLNPTHLGTQVAFYTGLDRHCGRLDAIYTPRSGVRTLTISSGRFHNVPVSSEVDLIEESR